MRVFDNLLLLFVALGLLLTSAWGWYAHRLITERALYGLPHSLFRLYKPVLPLVIDASVSADRRRFTDSAEAMRHFIDLDVFRQQAAAHPFPWQPDDSLVQSLSNNHGGLPWAILAAYHKLVWAWRNQNAEYVIKMSGDLCHYVEDGHVPLHTHSNYDGQKTGQPGIHALWESRIPERMGARRTYEIIPKPVKNVEEFIWRFLLEAHQLCDTLLSEEEEQRRRAGTSAFGWSKNWRGQLIDGFSDSYIEAYQKIQAAIVQRQIQRSAEDAASLLLTAWMEAGSPNVMLDEAGHVSDTVPPGASQEKGTWIGRKEE